MDWECFATPQEAERRAAELVRRDETYVIEEQGETCQRCQAALNLKHEHGAREGIVMPKADPNPEFRYPWQQVVFDAFMERRPECLAGKVNVAERAISARLRDPALTELDERIALKEALNALRTLVSEKVQREEESGSNAAIA